MPFFRLRRRVGKSGGCARRQHDAHLEATLHAISGSRGAAVGGFGCMGVFAVGEPAGVRWRGQSRQPRSREGQRTHRGANYQKAIQTAFREVADGSATRANIDERLAALQSLVGASQAAYDLSMSRYRNGVDSYLSC